MRSISTRLAFILLTCALAWGQGPTNIDTEIKGSRWPAFGIDSGAANAYVVTTVAPLGPALRTGSKIIFFATHANTTASTLAVDSGSAVAIKKNVSADLAAGDIPLNGLVEVVYDGTNFQCANCGMGNLITGVSSVFGRSGAVVAQSGDYTCSEVTGCQTGPGSPLTQLISGGGVEWTGTGYVFTVGAATYLINGTQYSSALTQVTLAAADPSNDRIDVIGVDDTGTVFSITGTPAVNPVQPTVDPSTQLELTFVYVSAGSTQPPQITREAIYIDNTQWTGTRSPATNPPWNLASTNNPYTPASGVDIEATTAATGNYISYVKPGAGTVDLGTDTSMIFYIRSKATWANTRSLTFQWYNGSTARCTAISFKNGTYNFNSSNTTSYQQIVIPTSAFNCAGILLTTIRVTIGGTGTNLGFYLADWTIQGNPAQSGSGTNIQINGAATLSTANFNGSTPALDANSYGISFKAAANGSGNATNVRAELTGNGNAAQFLNGTGAFSTPANGISGMTTGQVAVAGSASTITSSVAASTAVNGQTCALGGTCTVTAAPSGTAGGDLSGSYPNPTVAKVNGSTPGGSCTNQVVTSLSSSAVPTCSTVANTMLANSSTTVNSQTCTLGSTCTIPLYYQTVQANGTGETQRAALNLKSGTGATVSCADNSGAGSTDCTVAATGSGGTVTSVGLSLPSAFTVTNSPVTGSGTLTGTWNVSGADYVITSTGANAASWGQINGGSSCGDASHAVSYSTTTHLFGCQAISVGTGTVTTTGSPAAHQPAVFSGATSITGVTAGAADSIFMGNDAGATSDPAFKAGPSGGTNGCAGATDTPTYNTSTHAWGCHQITPGTGTVTSVGLAGTTNQITVTGSSPITTSGSWTLSLPAAVILGTDNSTAGTLQLANGAANAHTIWASGATTTNTVAGFTVVPTTGHLVTCTSSGTTCTLTDGGAMPSSLPPSGTAGGDLSGSYPNPGVAKVNAGSIPASATLVGTNSSSQFVSNTTSYAIGPGSSTAGHCAKFSGTDGVTLADAGAACGSGGGSGSPAGPGFNFGQCQSTYIAGNISTLSCASGFNVAVGDQIVLFCSLYSNDGGTTVFNAPTDSLSISWTQDVTYYSSTTGNRMTIWHGTSGATGAETISCNSSVAKNYWSMAWVQIVGETGADTTVTNQGTGTSVFSGSFTTTVDDDLAFLWVGTAGNDINCNLSGGWNLIQSNALGSYLGFKKLAKSGTYTMRADNCNATWSAIGVAYK